MLRNDTQMRSAERSTAPLSRGRYDAPHVNKLYTQRPLYSGETCVLFPLLTPHLFGQIRINARKVLSCNHQGDVTGSSIVDRS